MSYTCYFLYICSFKMVLSLVVVNHGEGFAACPAGPSDAEKVGPTRDVGVLFEIAPRLPFYWEVV